MELVLALPRWTLFAFSMGVGVHNCHGVDFTEMTLVVWFSWSYRGIGNKGRGTL